MDVGTELRKGRERSGISLAAVAAATKIGVANLQAIERGDFARLPGGVFTRGFLRAYAREVGLDPEETVQHYLSQITPPQPAQPSSSDARNEQNVLSPVEMEELERRSQHKQLLGGAIVLLIGPFLYFAIFGRQSGATSGAAGQSPPAATLHSCQAGSRHDRCAGGDQGSLARGGPLGGETSPRDSTGGRLLGLGHRRRPSGIAAAHGCR